MGNMTGYFYESFGLDRYTTTREEAELSAERMARRIGKPPVTVQARELDVLCFIKGEFLDKLALLADGTLVMVSPKERGWGDSPNKDDFELAADFDKAYKTWSAKRDEEAAQINAEQEAYLASIAPMASKDAQQIIREWKGSDSPRDDVRVKGQLLTLAKIQSLVKESVYMDSANSYGYQGPKVEEKLYRLTDGSALTLWVFTVGYSEGYQCVIFDTKKELNTLYWPNAI